MENINTWDETHRLAHLTSFKGLTWQGTLELHQPAIWLGMEQKFKSFDFQYTSKQKSGGFGDWQVSPPRKPAIIWRARYTYKLFLNMVSAKQFCSEKINPSICARCLTDFGIVMVFQKTV